MRAESSIALIEACKKKLEATVPVPQGTDFCYLFCVRISALKVTLSLEVRWVQMVEGLLGFLALKLSLGLWQTHASLDFFFNAWINVENEASSKVTYGK